MNDVHVKSLKSANRIVIAGYVLLATVFSGKLFANDVGQSLHVVYDVTFNENGKSVTTPRVVTIDHQDLERQRKEEAEYEAARAALYQTDSVEDRILRNVGLMRCGTFGPHELRRQKSPREMLFEKAQLTLSDVQLDSLLVKILEGEPTLTDRQMHDIFQILHQGGDGGWRAIETVSSKLKAMADTARRNFPPRGGEEDVYEDLVRYVYELGEMRLHNLLNDGVPEDRLRDDISMNVLDKLVAGPGMAGSDLGNEIQGFLVAVRSSEVSRRWQ